MAEIQEKRVARLYEETKAELESIGLPISENIIGIKVNNRTKSKLGCCLQKMSLLGVMQYTIEISKVILQADDKAVKEIIAHELIHTCKDCMNHGAKWREYCARANARYGYKIERTKKVEEIGIKLLPAKREVYKYRILCTVCGQEILRKRMCPLVERPSRYRCGKCGGKLKLM